MSGLGFIHIGFLAAGLAVALPVFIHLLFRQRARTVVIGSARFLEQVVREHRRRRRLRQWLLLALRSLAVLALALLFARPYLDQTFRRSLQQEHVLLLDRSASMQVRDAEGRSAWQRAVQECKAELARLDENVVVHLALCDAGGVEEIPLESLAARGDTEPLRLATDFGLGLSWAGDVLAASGRIDRRITLITDLQRGGTRRTPLVRLARGVRLEIRDVGRQVSQDLAVMTAEAAHTEIRPGEPVALSVAVRNFGAVPQRQVRLAVSLEGPSGKVENDLSFDVAGGRTADLSVPLTVEADGVYHGTVRIEHEDELLWDNQRWIAFEARRPDRLLLVDGQEGRSVYGNETYYLERAIQLRPKASAAGRRSFEVERIVWEAGEGFPSLEGFRAIVLANVRRLRREDADRLREFVEAGGSVLVFAGDQAAGSLSAMAEEGLLPGPAAQGPAAGAWRVAEWDRRHPALEVFNDPQYGDLRRLVVHRLQPLEPAGESDRVLMRAGEHALVTERAVGKGRCLLIATSADRDWSDWPRTRLYVPLVRQFVAYATGQLAERPAVALELVTQRDQVPGISTSEGRVLVRNLDADEADPERVTLETLLAAAGAEEDRPADESATQTAALALAPDALRPDEIWTALVWLLLIVLAVELLLASRIHA
jgi:hypothetical protein